MTPEERATIVEWAAARANLIRAAESSAPDISEALQREGRATLALLALAREAS